MSHIELTRTVACIAALVGAIATTAPAHALSINGGATTGSSFQANLIYSATTPISATLTVDLTNTTPAAVGGFLTAFVLNNPDDRISLVSLQSAPANWNLLGLGDNTVNGAPFGRFDFGASTGNNFEGGGNPNLGLAAGGTGTFRFDLVGTDLNTLTAGSFVSESSVPPGAGQGTQFFAARFRGSDDEGHVAAIPEASSHAALLAGIVLLTLRLRRRLPPS